jgi:transcriptional regulator with XRE-family HTH domain
MWAREQSLSSRKASRALHVTRDAYFAWIRGESIPQRFRLPNLAETLQVDLATIIAEWEHDRLVVARSNGDYTVQNTAITQFLVRLWTRPECNLTNAEVAQRLGVHDATIYRWLTAQTIPSNDYLAHICEVFSVEADIAESLLNACCSN